MGSTFRSSENRHCSLIMAIAKVSAPNSVRGVWQWILTERVKNYSPFFVLLTLFCLFYLLRYLLRFTETFKPSRDFAIFSRSI